MENKKQETYKTEGTKLFIGGDLSGIQKYLYNISSKKAMVSLKGRSAFLVDYTEQLCNGIRKLPGVNNTEEIYCSGGKFYAIADNTEEARNAIDAFYKKQLLELWNKHKGQLGLNIAYVAYTPNADGTVTIGTETGKIGLLWKYASQEFNRLKNEKFKSVILEDYDSLFSVNTVGGAVRHCAITGIESTDCVPLDREAKGEDILYVLPSVKEQVTRGIELRNQQNFKTFEEYAQKSYLGVLRMDVDGLGKRFITGFDSMEEYSAFSTHLLHFFENVISNMQKEDDYKEHLNIIYAGGDDLFVVGRWNMVIEFANDVRRRFSDYIKDPNITISGGIAIVNPKYPIAKAAELSGEAEDKAKDFSIEVQGLKKQKNAFCMFGESVSWAHEFDYVKEYKQQFYDLIEYNNMSRGILHKIMTYAMIVQRNEKMRKQGKKEDYSFMWHSAYYLTRLYDRYKNSNLSVAHFILDLRDKQLSNNKRNYILLALAARWAEIELRDNN